MKKLFLILFVFSLNTLFAQDAKLSVSVDREIMLMGNVLEVTFSLENTGKHQFETPTFADFEIVSTSQSSQMSVINGEMSQSKKYTYLVKPKEIGSFYIDQVVVEIGGTLLETTPIEIIVQDNPDGIKEDIKRENDFNSFFRNDEFTQPREPEQAKKKKRKVYKL